MAHPASESSSSLKVLANREIGTKIFNWAVGAIVGITVIIAFGEKFYATREELTQVKMDVRDVSTQIRIQSEQLIEMRGSQSKEFGKLETRLERMEELILSQKAR